MTWTDLLVESSLRSFAVAAVVAVAIAAWRGRSTTTELRLWTLVLAASIAMPLIVATPATRLEIPVLPASWTAAPPASPVGAAPDIEPHAIASGALLPDRGGLPTATEESGWSWGALFAAFYGAGVAVLLMRALLGWCMVVRLERSATTIDEPAVHTRFASHARNLGVRRLPRLAAHPGLFVPISTSILRPAILLPANWLTWSTVKFDAVIVHELSHVARHDALTRRVSSIYRAVFWCNPLAWWLHQRIANLSERASDEAALAHGVDPVDYAGTLLDFFRVPERPRLASWHVAMARGRGAERRVEWILDWEAPMTRRMKSTMVLLGVMLVPAALAAAIARPVAIAAPVAVEPPVVAIAPAGDPARPPANLPASDRVEAPAPTPTPAPAPAARPATKPASTGGSVPSPPSDLATPPPSDQAATIQAATIAGPAQSIAFGQAVRPGSGVTMPVLVRQQRTRYPPEARAAKVEGSVELEAVVGVDGTVTDVRITRSLDTKYGLDAEAVRAARGWLFKPGMRDGKPVPVIVVLILEFRLGAPRTAEEQLFDDALPADTPGLVKPEHVRTSEAKYTSDALRARVSGVVELEVVVLPDGTVGAVRVVQSLDTVFGLDAQAVEAARSWLYRPGTLNGQAVPVLINMTMSFRIR